MSEMENFEDNHSLYVSDMINIIMQIDGVKGVRHLSFFIQSKDIDCVEIERHKISLKNEFVEKNPLGSLVAMPNQSQKHAIELIFC